MLTQNLDITIEAEGVTQGFGFQAGEHWLIFRADTWGSVTLQMSADGSPGSYADVTDLDTGDSIVITNDWNYPVSGGVYYRFNATDVVSDITVKSRRATRS